MAKYYVLQIYPDYNNKSDKIWLIELESKDYFEAIEEAEEYVHNETQEILLSEKQLNKLKEILNKD